jgi:arsenate reductase (glutaredoxin)
VSIEIWHNPRCSKSRQALALITDAGIEPRVRRYLEDPPSAGELKEALEALGLEPWELARGRLSRWPRTSDSASFPRRPKPAGSGSKSSARTRS